MSYRNNKTNKNNVTMSVVIVVAILLLAVAVTAALTKGFTDANPYGWLDKPQKNEVGSLEVGDEITGVKLQIGNVDVEKLERKVADATMPKACSFEGDGSSLYSGVYIYIQGYTDARLIVLDCPQYHYSICYCYNPNDEAFVLDSYRGYVLEPNKWYMWTQFDSVTVEFHEVENTTVEFTCDAITVSDNGYFDLLAEIIVPIHAEADAE